MYVQHLLTKEKFFLIWSSLVTFLSSKTQGLAVAFIKNAAVRI